MTLGLGFGLMLRSLGRGFGNGGGINLGSTLDARPTARTSLLAGAATLFSNKLWVNDPAYADRIGYYAAGGPNMALTEQPFASIFTFARASKAWDVDAYGALSEHAVGAIRQGYSAGGAAPAGWLLEGAAVNGIRNVRSEGAVAGTPGVLPNFWGSATTQDGLTREVSLATIGGIPGVVVRYYGTPTASGALLLVFETTTGIAAANGQTWVQSLYARLMAGSLANLAQSHSPLVNDSGAVGVAVMGGGAIAADGTLRRFVMPAATISAPTAAYILPRVRLTYTLSAPVDASVFWAAPQLEQNYYASSTIFPAVGVPAAATRAADSLAIDGARFNAIWPAQDLRTNSALWSEAFDNAAWSKSGGTVTANAAADPFGGAAADKFADDATTGDHRLNQTVTLAAGASTLSVYVKAVERSKIRLQLDGTLGGVVSGCSVDYDLTAGTIATNSVSGNLSLGAPASMLAAGGGWFRLQMVANAAAGGSGTSRLLLLNPGNSYAGVAGEGALFFGAQLEVTPVTPSANLLASAETFETANWPKVAATVTANVATPLAPDVTATADKLEEDATTAGHYVTQTFSATAGQPYTASVYARAAERSAVQLIVTAIGTANANAIANFDLTNGVASGIGGATAAITAVGNGWYRCALSLASASQTISATVQIRTLAPYAAAGSPASHAGTLGSGVHIWGAQIVSAATAPAYVPLSALVSPYIATTTAAASRFVGTAKEGWVIVDATCAEATVGVNRHIMHLDDSTANNRLLFRSGGGGTSAVGSAIIAGGNLNTASAGTLTFPETRRWGMKWANGSVSYLTSGGTMQTLTPGAFPGFTTLRIGGSSSSAEAVNGRIVAAFAGAVAPSDAKFAQMCAAPGVALDPILLAP